MEKSLAGTEQQYISVQGRITNGGNLHVQGGDGAGNREYGVAVTFSVSSSLRNWLEAQDHRLKSLAGSNSWYVPMQARLDDSCHAVLFQVKGSSWNRDYGYAFTVGYHHALRPLVEWLREQLTAD